MRLRSRSTVLIAIGLAVVALAQITGSAGASHVREKGASPITDSLVISHRPCIAPNATHNAPLLFPSCNPPVQSSQYLTVGTPDSNGAQANFIGRVQVLSVASPPDVRVIVEMTDIRCRPTNTAAACMVPGTANTASGPDYTGQLEAVIGFRLSDHYNDPSTGFVRAGTTAVVPLRTAVPCQTTPSPLNIGMTCGINTTANAVWGTGAVIGGRRMVFEIPQSAPGGGIKIFDGGATSVAGDPNATLFAQPGVFLP